MRGGDSSLRAHTGPTAPCLTLPYLSLGQLSPILLSTACAARTRTPQEGRIITTGDMSLVDKLEEEGYAVLKST